MQLAEVNMVDHSLEMGLDSVETKDILVAPVGKPEAVEDWPPIIFGVHKREDND